MSSNTSGELENPHSGTLVPLSTPVLRDHTTAPLRASSAFRIPVAPNVYTRPLLSVGVARGPAPPFDSQNRAASLCFHTGSPVVTLYSGHHPVDCRLHCCRRRRKRRRLVSAG